MVAVDVPTGLSGSSTEVTIEQYRQFRPDAPASGPHAPYATAYAVRKMDIPYVTDAAFKQPQMPHVDFSPSGSDDLAKKIAHAVRENDKFRVIMLDQHGIIAVGVDLVQAYNFADLAEEMAKIAYISSTILG